MLVARPIVDQESPARECLGDQVRAPLAPGLPIEWPLTDLRKEVGGAQDASELMIQEGQSLRYRS